MVAFAHRILFQGGAKPDGKLALLLGKTALCMPWCVYPEELEVDWGQTPARPVRATPCWWGGREIRARRAVGNRLALSPGRGPFQMSLCSFLPCLLHLHPLSWLSQNLNDSSNCSGLDGERRLSSIMTHANICHTREHCGPWTRNPMEAKSNKIITAYEVFSKSKCPWSAK